MTVRLEVLSVLACDEVGCSNERHGCYGSDVQARVAAHADGWWSPNRFRDYCPEHAGVAR